MQRNAASNLSHQHVGLAAFLCINDVLTVRLHEFPSNLVAAEFVHVFSILLKNVGFLFCMMRQPWHLLPL